MIKRTPRWWLPLQPKDFPYYKTHILSKKCNFRNNVMKSNLSARKDVKFLHWSPLMLVFGIHTLSLGVMGLHTHLLCLNSVNLIQLWVKQNTQTRVWNQSMTEHADLRCMSLNTFRYKLFQRSHWNKEQYLMTDQQVFL